MHIHETICIIHQVYNPFLSFLLYLYCVALGHLFCLWLYTDGFLWPSLDYALSSVSCDFRLVLTYIPEIVFDIVNSFQVSVFTPIKYRMSAFSLDLSDVWVIFSKILVGVCIHYRLAREVYGQLLRFFMAICMVVCARNRGKVGRLVNDCPSP